MQHIASQAALESSTSRLLTLAAPLDESRLATLGSELEGVAALLGGQPALRRLLSESTTAADDRARLLTGLLSGKVSASTTTVVDYAVRQSWATGHDLADGLRRLGRTALFLGAERSGDLDEVEDQLFRFERIVDANPALGLLLDDPATEPAGRAAVVSQLLAGKASPLTSSLLTALAMDPGGASFSHGVTELIEQAAQRRDKIVAVVHSALPLSDDQVDRLRAALRRIYSRDVSVHVFVDPTVGGGLRIKVGDEVIDGTVAGRLEALRRALAR
jgi:F-type H+-transporting ATPase subunit delta